MAWVRIDDCFADHPKVIGLSDAAFRLYVQGMCYAARQLTDGFLPLIWLTGGKGREPKATHELVQAGLWDATEGGYQVHDYLSYQLSRDEVRANRKDLHRIRAEAGRRGGLAAQANKQTSSKSQASASSKIQANAEQTFQANVKPHPIPSHPIPKEEPKPETAAASRPAPLIMNSLAREQSLRFNAFVGARLQVPNKLHGDFRRELGGTNPEVELGKFYAAVDEEIERTGETISPDIWKWLTARFNAFKADRAFSAEIEAHRPKGA